MRGAAGLVDELETRALNQRIAEFTTAQGDTAHLASHFLPLARTQYLSYPSFHYILRPSAFPSPPHGSKRNPQSYSHHHMYRPYSLN